MTKQIKPLIIGAGTAGAGELQLIPKTKLLGVQVIHLASSFPNFFSYNLQLNLTDCKCKVASGPVYTNFGKYIIFM